MEINFEALRAVVSGLEENARIYVLSLTKVPVGYDAILRRSGIFHGTTANLRASFGTSPRSPIDRLNPLVLVRWDGSTQVTRHAPHTLGFRTEVTTEAICVTSLEGIRCKDGRDLKQRNAFTPEGITAGDTPE